MKRLHDEQIRKARSISLLDYFRATNPACLKHQSGGRYVHKDHDSFVIANSKNNSWYWNSKGESGANAIDYLIKIEGMDFVSAVKTLTGDRDTKNPPTSFHSETKIKSPEPRKDFSLPVPGTSNDHIAEYLSGRGISLATIRRCINKAILYESANGNCIFVGRDAEGKPRFAAERGTASDMKKDIAGSDKRFGFCIPPDSPYGGMNLFVFESAIDAMAHKEVEAMSGGKDGYRLSLSGVAPAALFHFLQNNPQITTVYLCLDSDKAGHEASMRISQALRGETEHFKIPKDIHAYEIGYSPPPIGKDYAETLQALQKLNKEVIREKNLEKSGAHDRKKRAALAAFSI